MPTDTQWHRHKYLESQTQAQTYTALKKKKNYVHDEKQVEKDIWIMNEISNSIVYKFVYNKDKRKR